jgi:saccharopine dehydrogenase (NAD+, L-lysine forming)
MAETASGGPFPEVLAHEVFLNCILARPGCPVFVPASARDGPAR